MDNYKSKVLLSMPFPKPLKKMTNDELNSLLAGQFNYNVLIPALIEANIRKDKHLAELTKRISYLEKKTLQKPGRKKQDFYINGEELTDEYLMKLIDEGYFDSIGKLEKEVSAGKNQLRNRYNKAKEKLRQERRINSYGNR